MSNEKKCQDCGMPLKYLSQWHPLAACELYKYFQDSRKVNEAFPPRRVSYGYILPEEPPDGEEG